MAVDPAAPDIAARLAAALSGIFHIDEELRARGMSRVFLATELRFRRRLLGPDPADIR